MMKKLLLSLPVLLFLAASIQAKQPDAAVTANRPAMPLLFAENKGQVTDLDGHTRPDILFTTTGGAAHVFLSATGIAYQFNHTIGEGEQASMQTHLFTLKLKGANPAAKIRKEQKNTFTQNFYTAGLPEEGITHVATYGKIVYENIYPGIDWVLYSKNGQLKYDFIVKPGADPSLIRLDIKDADEVRLTGEGALEMKTRLGTVQEQAPVSYCKGREVPSRFRRYADGALGFELQYDPAATLVIDPSVTWSTYYGGTGQDYPDGLTLDASGNIYIAGTTGSATGIATAGGFQTAVIGAYDNFLVKFSASGTPLWGTYYGSSYATNPMVNVESKGACAADNAGNVYLWATTAIAPLSNNMTTPGAYQTVHGGYSDAYLVKFDASGARLWATYFGGSASETSLGCVSTAAGEVYVTGSTSSLSGIASPGAYQSALSGGTSNDFFVAKFSAAGGLLWSTYFGGPGAELIGSTTDASTVHNCALDNAGNLLVAGNTNSSSGIASPGAQQASLNGANDAFLAKFSAAGSLLWSTYFGGNNQDSPLGAAVAVDAADNVFLGGDTYSPAGLATPGAYQATYGGGGDNYLAKFNSSGVLQWATYQGGSGYEMPGSLSVNAAGSIYLTGGTYSFNPLSGGFQSVQAGGADGIIFKYSNAGVLQWSSYFGGPATDLLYASVPDGQDLVVLGKTTSVAGIATPGAYKTTISGTLNDVYLARINDVPACTPDSVMLNDTICSNQLPYAWQGNSIAAGGVDVATDTLTNTAGCDSVLHLTLVVKPVAATTVYDTTCRNDFPYSAGPFAIPVAPSGNTATATYTATAANGCDSVVTLNLYLKDTSAVTETKTYCRNELPDVWNGIAIPVTAVSNPAFATFTMPNAAGCDSVVTLNLVVHDTSVATETKTYCRNELPDVWNGITIPITAASNPAFATFTTPNAAGCDSVVTLDLIVKDTSAFTDYMTKCSNQLPFSWNGIMVTAGGPAAASVTLTNATGCDSVVTLNLTVNNTSAFTDYMTKCSNQLPFSWNGIMVTAGGPAAASVTLTNAAGCDSVVTLDLTVNAVSASTEYDTVCAGALPYTWYGQTITAGGPNAGSITFSNAANCDSVVTLNLTVVPNVIPTISISATPGTTVPLGTAVTFTATVTNGGPAPVLQWKKNGTNVGINSASYTDFSISSGDVIACVLASNAPCALPDTAASNTLTMTVVIPPPPCLVPVTLISTDILFSSATFKWAEVASAEGYEIALDMQPSDPGSGMFTTDTEYHASALSPGVHYFHIRTRCANNEYSPWIKIKITILDPTGIGGPGNQAGQLELYPNPNNGNFSVRGSWTERDAAIDIVDQTGRLVYKAKAAAPGGKLDHRIELAGRLTQGIYLLRVASGSQVTVIRFVYN